MDRSRRGVTAVAGRARAVWTERVIVNPLERFSGPADGDLRIGEWMVEPELNRVSRDGRTMRLEPRVMQVLVCLAEHAGAVVPRGTLLDAVWTTHFVAANTLTHAICEIRRALGDDAGDPTYVETIPKRGYRLVAPVTRPEDWRRSTAPDKYSAVVDGQRVPLDQGEHVIGRDADADIRVEVAGVSRRHARLRVHGGSIYVEDLGSKNGTWVNGRRIEGATALRDGAVVRLGRCGSWLRVCGPETETATDGDLEIAPSTDPPGRERRRRESARETSASGACRGRFTRL